jgi:Tfp pilus assembly protein PilX
MAGFANRPHPNPLPKGEGTRCRQQRGAILVVVLVCLAVATALSVVVVRQTTAEHQAAQTNHRHLQALWLTEAGVERATARVIADSAYTGETWTISAKELAGDDNGVVRIQVQTIAGQPERRSVRVEADYPNAPAYRCRQVKQIVVDRDAILSRQQTKAPQ